MIQSAPFQPTEALLALEIVKIDPTRRKTLANHIRQVCDYPMSLSDDDIIARHEMNLQFMIN